MKLPASYPMHKNLRFSSSGLLGKYFFTSYRRTILVGSGVLLAIILLGQIIYSLPAIIASGFNIAIVLKIIFSYSPQALAIILPLVASFGVFVAMRRQLDNHEILMARGFGAAEKQLLRVVQKLGLIGFLVLLLLKCYLAPWGHKNYRDVKFAATQNIARAMVAEGRFFSTSGFTIFIGKKSFNGALSDIFIFDNRKPGRVAAISAQKGAMINNILTLNHGIEFQVGGPRVTSLTFDRYSMDVSIFQKKYKRRSVTSIDFNELLKIFLAAPPDSARYGWSLIGMLERVVYSSLIFFLPLFSAMILWRSKIDKLGRYFRSLALVFCLTVGFFVIHLVAYNYARNHLAQWYMVLMPLGLMMATWLLLTILPRGTSRKSRASSLAKIE